MCSRQDFSIQKIPFIYFFLLCAQDSILSSPTCDCLRALVDLKEYDRWGAPVSSPERRQRRGRPMRNQKKKKTHIHPPQTHTHPTNPKVPSHTPDVELRGVFLCVLVPFINQPSILHKNMEELLFPTIHSIYNGSSAQQQKKRVNGKTRN